MSNAIVADSAAAESTTNNDTTTHTNIASTANAKQTSKHQPGTSATMADPTKSTEHQPILTNAVIWMRRAKLNYLDDVNFSKKNSNTVGKINKIKPEKEGKQGK